MAVSEVRTESTAMTDNTEKNANISCSDAALGENLVEDRARNRIAIIQLSDLQFGHKHTFGNPSNIADKLILDVQEMAHKHDFMPSYLVLSGDITETGHADEFKDAENVINIILKDLSIDKVNLLCVPGNHDVSRDLSKVSDVAGDTQLKFLPYNNFVENVAGRDGCLKNDCYPNIEKMISDYAVTFLLLNSCEKEDHETHEAYVSTEKVKKTLPRKKSEEYDKLKIAILHHQLYPGVCSQDGPNTIRNASDIFSILSCHKYSIVLSGHVHKSDAYDRSDGKGGRVIFACCGATGVKKQERSENTANQYAIHIIDFNEELGFKTLWRGFRDSADTIYGRGGWDEYKPPTQFTIPSIEKLDRDNRGTPQNIKPSAEDVIQKPESSGIASENIDKTKLAIAMLLGGWNEND